METLQRNLDSVNERIAAARARSGRHGESVTLVAVTKTVSAEAVAAAWELGVRHFGENRVEDAEPKITEVNRLVEGRPTWHMVGHIQSRKTRDVVRLFDFVQSVDSAKLVAELEKRAAALGRAIPCLLEINTSGEASKYGIAGGQGPDSPDEWAGVVAIAQALAAAPHLRAEGLMTLGPLGAPPAEVRRCFRTLRRWREFLQQRVPEADWHHLSMGMTDDYEIAVEEGATIVRIGRAIFQTE
jgi:pyridoxal phosphate enzyme (YggS family)